MYICHSGTSIEIAAADLTHPRGRAAFRGLTIGGRLKAEIEVGDEGQQRQAAPRCARGGSFKEGVGKVGGMSGIWTDASTCHG